MSALPRSISRFADVESFFNELKKLMGDRKK